MPKSKIKIGDNSYDYESETIDELLDMLNSYKFMPKMQVSNDVQGYGDYEDRTNTLRISPYGGNINTMAHELSHAVDNLMGMERQELKGKFTPSLQDTLYSNAYDKLNPAATKIPTQGLSKYRKSPDELRAFGVGNASTLGSINPGTPHLDATMAQEAAILRELLNRRKKQ